MGNLSEQQRGSNGWAIDELLERGLRRLIDDLREIETRGFGEDICGQVTSALYHLSTAAGPATGASFAPEITVEGGFFHKNYVEWNGSGTSSETSAIMSRRGRIGELIFWRNRMLKKLREGRKAFRIYATDNDFAIIRSVYQHLGPVVASNPAIFKKLKRSVTKFEAATKHRP